MALVCCVVSLIIFIDVIIVIKHMRGILWTVDCDVLFCELSR